MKILISGLVNIETTLRINSFPIHYYPVDYPFYGIHSSVSGVAYNLAKALGTLQDSVQLFSLLGNDDEALRILNQLQKDNISTEGIMQVLSQTPVSVILYDKEGKRQIYCDLKDIQEKTLPMKNEQLETAVKECDLVVACNINFNRSLLKKAKQFGKQIATDVHVLSDLEDEFNREFMEYADILFLSDEKLPCRPEEFLYQLAKKYKNKVIVVGRGSCGAMLYDREQNKLWQLDPVPCDNVVNTVGAGDALFSSFLHYYQKGYSTVEALVRAEAFASIKIGHNGAATGFCSEEEVEKTIVDRRPAVNKINLECI